MHSYWTLLSWCTVTDGHFWVDAQLLMDTSELMHSYWWTLLNWCSYWWTLLSWCTVTGYFCVDAQLLMDTSELMHSYWWTVLRWCSFWWTLLRWCTVTDGHFWVDAQLLMDTSELMHSYSWTLLSWCSFWWTLLRWCNCLFMLHYSALMHVHISLVLYKITSVLGHFNRFWSMSMSMVMREEDGFFNVYCLFKGISNAKGSRLISWHTPTLREITQTWQTNEIKPRVRRRRKKATNNNRFKSHNSSWETLFICQWHSQHQYHQT